MSQLDFNFSNTLFLLVILFGLIFSSSLIISNRKNKSSNFWFGIFLCAYSGSLIQTYLWLINLQTLFPEITWAYYGSVLIIPFTLWAYVLVLIKGSFAIKIFESIILVSIGMEIAIHAISFLLEIKNLREAKQMLEQFFSYWFILFIVCLTFFTIIKAFFLVNNFEKKLKNNYSIDVKKEIMWIKNLLVFIFIVFAIWLVTVPLRLHFNIQLPYYWLQISQIGLIAYLAFINYSQPELKHNFNLVKSYEVTIASIKKKPFNKVLNIDKDLEEKLKRIDNAMKRDKIYRIQKLTVYDMSKKVHIPTRELSFIINQNYKQSFNDFINTYRVEDVKQRIIAKDTKQLTLLAIGLEAGFNSKSSFQVMFRKFSGESPKEFEKKININ